MKIKQCSLFSGIGAFEKALENNGVDFEITSYCEINKYSSCAYAAIHGVSEDLNLGDVSKVKSEDIPEFNLLTWGFPCQDISIAGKQAGIKIGTRSGLYYEGYRILKDRLPKYSIIENVKNLTSKRHIEKLRMILQDLKDLGYKNHWAVLNAKDFGVPQNRERIFIVSILGDGHFSFPDGFDNGIRLKDVLESEVDEKYYLSDTMTKGFVEKQPGLGYINQDTQASKVIGVDGLSSTICSGTHGYAQGYIKQVGMLDIKGNEQVRRVYSSDGVSPTLNTMQGGNRQPKIVVREATKKGYALAEIGDSINISQPNSKTRRGRVGKQIANTLLTGCEQCVVEPQMYIRKLTPLECWRLMGFSDDDYSKARSALIEKLYNGNDRANSQLYKMAGNSIVVNVLMAIFKELLNPSKKVKHTFIQGELF